MSDYSKQLVSIVQNVSLINLWFLNVPYSHRKLGNYRYFKEEKNNKKSDKNILWYK